MIPHNLTFEKYQNMSAETAIYPEIGHRVVYPTLGLVNEAGEFAGKIKKVFRDKKGEISDEQREALKAELGDVAWYLSQCATELGLDLQDVFRVSLVKVFDRKERGKIQGSGDNR